MEKVDIGNATLYRADCLDVLPALGKVDAVVTDPPYGIGVNWQGGSGARHGWSNQHSMKETRNSWDAKRPAGSTFTTLRCRSRYQVFWGGNYFADMLPPTRGWFVWNKPERGFTLAEAELAWTNRDNIIRVFDYKRSDNQRFHPTQKPYELMVWCLQYFDDANLILDPFMGSGTTGVACAKLGRSFIGVELEPKYFDIACERIQKAYDQPDLFIPQPKKAEQIGLL